MKCKECEKRNKKNKELEDWAMSFLLAVLIISSILLNNIGLGMFALICVLFELFKKRSDKK